MHSDFCRVAASGACRACPPRSVQGPGTRLLPRAARRVPRETLQPDEERGQLVEVLPLDSRITQLRVVEAIPVSRPETRASIPASRVTRCDKTLDTAVLLCYNRRRSSITLFHQTEGEDQ